MYHAHHALADATRADLIRQIHSHHGVPGTDFDGVVPRTTRTTRSQRRALRRHQD